MGMQVGMGKPHMKCWLKLGKVAHVVVTRSHMGSLGWYKMGVSPLWRLLRADSLLIIPLYTLTIHIHS